MAMVNQNPPQEQAVYVALKSVFTGENAKVRRLPVVKKMISQRKTDPTIATLIKQHGNETLSTVASSLLSNGIFESTLKAKVRFPKLFDLSAAQNANRGASAAKAVKSEAKAIKDAAKTGQGSLDNETECDRVDTENGNGGSCSPSSIGSIY